MATTKLTSAGIEAAIMETESAPPGLVARKAVKKLTPAHLTRTSANAALTVINKKMDSKM